MVNQPILRGLESYHSDMSYPRSLPPNVVLAMSLPSLHALQKHPYALVMKTRARMGSKTTRQMKRDPIKAACVHHASPGAPQWLIGMSAALYGTTKADGVP